jgi:hypothetical protein
LAGRFGRLQVGCQENAGEETHSPHHLRRDPWVRMDLGLDGSQEAGSTLVLK